MIYIIVLNIIIRARVLLRELGNNYYMIYIIVLNIIIRARVLVRELGNNTLAVRGWPAVNCWEVLMQEVKRKLLQLMACSNH